MCGCTGKAEKERQDSIRTADSVAHAEALKAAEQARLDSIKQLPFKNDDIKEKHIVVDKPSFTLFVRENDKTLLELPVCLGKGVGQKKRKGDHKTPEGSFKITSIAQSSSWPHDFHDGKGKVRGAYGPWFFRLNTPQSTHIGIHGTLAPETMGTRDSDGCVRLRNEDLEELRKHVKVGMKVLINPDVIPEKEG